MRRSGTNNLNDSSKMIDYNDYVNLTKGYLKSYNQFKMTLENLQREKAKDEEQLDRCDDIVASIAKYGPQATAKGGNNVYGNGVVDRTAEKREKIRERIVAMEDDINVLKVIIDKIDRAFLAITTVERDLLQVHFIEKYDWTVTGQRLGISRRWAIEKGNEGLRKMALMLFGSMASMPKHSRFVFVV